MAHVVSVSSNMLSDSSVSYGKVVFAGDRLEILTTNKEYRSSDVLFCFCMIWKSGFLLLFPPNITA